MGGLIEGTLATSGGTKGEGPRGEGEEPIGQEDKPGGQFPFPKNLNRYYSQASILNIIVLSDRSGLQCAAAKKGMQNSRALKSAFRKRAATKGTRRRMKERRGAVNKTKR